MRSLKVVSLAGLLVLGVLAVSPFGKLGIDVEPGVAEAACSEGTFTGDWVNDAVTLSTSGNQVHGTWAQNARPPFSGELTDDDDCTVLMDFPDDAIYTGTLVNSCRIQWSFPNQPGSVDPNNFWLCSGGQIPSDESDEDESDERAPRPNVGGAFAGDGGAAARNRARANAAGIAAAAAAAPAPSAAVRPPSTGDGGLLP